MLLCGPRGRAAAELLPGVDEIVEHRLPWIDPAPDPVDPRRHAAARRPARRRAAPTRRSSSPRFHQSPLPLALLLRLAGVGRDRARSATTTRARLLDVRHRVPAGVPEPERALSLAAAAGFALPTGDGPAPAPASGAGRRRPRSARPATWCCTPARRRRPGPARRSWPRGSSAALTAAGHRVVVTGGPDEQELTARVAGDVAVDLGGRTGLAGLAATVAGAGAVVVGNTGPAHLAAALGVPVVSLFAPTVPFGQWGPYRVPTVRLGDAEAACRDTRAARCPVPGHPCLSGVDPEEVVDALRLLGVTPSARSGPPTGGSSAGVTTLATIGGSGG